MPRVWPLALIDWHREDAADHGAFSSTLQS
jgi:hypothetical protein